MASGRVSMMVAENECCTIDSTVLAGLAVKPSVAVSMVERRVVNGVSASAFALKLVAGTVGLPIVAITASDG